MGKPKPRKSKGWRKQHKQWARNKNHIAKRDSARLAAAAREELLSAPTTAAAKGVETVAKQKKQRQGSAPKQYSVF